MDRLDKFATLFDGLKVAYGTGKGEWVKRPLRREDWAAHLRGEGPGIGIAPLREDSTVMFAAIDLDEPDFEAAREMQEYIPGVSWIERSRSGNAHVWVFFNAPCEAWVAMGVLKEAVLAAGKQGVEVFPKNHDFAKVRLGNYINLPYHGSERPVLTWSPRDDYQYEMSLDQFLTAAEARLNDPEDWRKKARWLLISPPDQRESSTEFGQQASLHICADYVLTGGAGNITEGHRNAVFFMLAKCLTNWRDCDHEEALALMRVVNEDLCSPPESDQEIRRILSNVERGQYTSTGCDDPLVLPFSHPNCAIAHPRAS